MVPALMMLRCGDGALATFDGSCEGSASVTARLLEASQVRARAPLSASGAGLERLVAQKALVLVDTFCPRYRLAHDRQGAPPYASTSAFEFSYEQDRIVVSCALEAAESAQLPMHITRSSAAHSMLTVASRNVSALTPFDRRRARVRVARSMQDGQTRLVISHDGLQESFRDRRLARVAPLARGHASVGLGAHEHQPSPRARLETRF